MKKVFYLVAVLGLIVPFVFVGSRAAPQGSLDGDGDRVTVLLMLGVDSSTDERWDGYVEVSNGRLASIEGRHFSGGDRITGPNSWAATNRRDEVSGFPRVNYTEMSPAELPPVLYFPVGVYLTIEPTATTHLYVKTSQGDFDFPLAEIGHEPGEFLGGQATAAWAPTVEKITNEAYEDDEAAVARLPDGSLAVAWVAYRDRADRVMVRMLKNGSWSPIEEATPEPGDLFRCSLAVDGDGHLWAFWSQRDGTRWRIWGRQRKSGDWQEPVDISGEGSNTFHRAAFSEDGTVFVAWQSHRGPAREAQSDIYLRAYSGGQWGSEAQMSNSPANDWEPNVAAGSDGTAYVVWDGYDKGDYDVFFRSYKTGGAGELQRITSSARFQAHASVAVGSDGRPWVAWDESGTNWAKDQGFLITPPLAVPIHQERSVRVVKWDGMQWLEPKAKIPEFYVYQLFPNFENPQLAFDGNGTLTMVFRHWTRVRARSIGSRMRWENYVTRFDGERWSTPVAVAHSQGSIEKRPALTRDADGNIFAAWMTDNREFVVAKPKNAEIYAASLGVSAGAPSYGSSAFQAYEDPFAEAVPVHPNEEEDIQRVRDYTVVAGDKRYKIYRGDMHRHTDVSQDFKYDGSLIEVYRYAMDAVGFDYIVPTDHQLGYDQEFTWWQDEKLTDLFNVPGTFTPMFGYERSLPFPNGHRNVIFPARGTRTLPIPEDERRGEVGAENLYKYLHKNNGISMPHSSGTAQGTDWRDNDPEVEPLIEIFQGYRASYEYLGAPLAASHQKLREQRSGFNPLGYWWDALRKGYKIGVQASSDHWSTHISYACILAEEFTRESMFEALKKRHAYGATDNIIMDFQAEADGETYIMGDIINSQTAPKITVKAIGTDRIKQVVIVKNEQFVYTGHPNTEEVSFGFVDRDFEPGSNYYYFRVVQNNGMVAWSSPIWVE